MAGAETITGLAAGSTSPTPLGDATTFFATVEAGTNVTYGWIFGDGNTGTGTHVEHTYAAPGSYTVTVTASNSLGAVSATLTVEILAPPTEEPAARVYLPLLQR
ncbi:MAG: PKD domain-containing protein [Caldilineaceae bacterium]